MKTWDELFVDFCTFSIKQLHSRDIDPAYPVIKNYMKIHEMGLRSQIHFLLVYVAFYNLQTASDFFHGSLKNVKTAKTGIERRGFRGNELVYAHLASFESTDIFYSAERGSWEKIQQEYERGKYTGPWSSYKFADLCKNVLERDISAHHLGLGGKGKLAGPIPGLALLTGHPWQMCATDRFLQNGFYNKCRVAGVPFSGLEELETCLCDFNSMYKGGYYTGHDIDKQWEDLQGASDDWWKARAQSFSPQYLGELNGWKGVRKDLKTRYRDEGVI